MFNDAGIPIDVCFVRLFEGIGDLCLVPLRVFGGVNVKAPSLGEVLESYDIRSGDSGLFLRRLRRGWLAGCSGLWMCGGLLGGTTGGRHLCVGSGVDGKWNGGPAATCGVLVAIIGATWRVNWLVGWRGERFKGMCKPNTSSGSAICVVVVPVSNTNFFNSFGGFSDLLRGESEAYFANGVP